MRSLTLMICVAGVVVAGCVGGPLDRLDDDAAELIRKRQALAVGPRSVSDEPIPDFQADPAERDMFDPTPDTRDPQVQELPAVTALPPDPDELLERLSAYGTNDAPGATAMDLESLLAYAIANAPDYRRQKEDLYLAALGLIIERHLWGPRFFNTVTAAFSGTPEAGDHETTFALLNEFRATQRLPYGGEVGVRALVDYVSLLQRGATTDPGTPSDTQSAAVGVSLDLPLLRGAGVIAREELIQAERDLIYATRAFERFRRRFFVDLAEDYFALILQRQQIENRRQQVENLEALAQLFEELAEAGREAFFQAERSRANLLFQQSNLISQLDNYQARLDALKIRIGMPTTERLVIQPVQLVVPEPVLEPETAIVTASQNRLDLQTTADRVDDARREVQVARNRLLPGLDLFADARVPTTSGKDRAGVDLDPGEGDWEAGVRFDVPLDQRDQAAQLRRTMVELERARRTLLVDTNEVARQVRSSIRQIRQARLNLELQQRNVAITERFRLSVQLRQRSLGPRDVIEAEEDVLNARNRRDQAAIDLQISVLEYLLNTGQMRVTAMGQWLPPAQLLPIEEQEIVDEDVQDSSGA
jgi:outer membrane protein TolC